MNTTSNFKNIKKIAILACANTRKDLIVWSYSNKFTLGSHIIISTARTAEILQGTLNIPVVNLDHGRAGGYQQVKNMIEDNQIDIIIFFGNPMKEKEKESWFVDLIDAAVQKDIVVAYNQATIEMVLTSIASQETCPQEAEVFRQTMLNGFDEQNS